MYFINSEPQINICGSFTTLDYTPSSLCHSKGPGFGESSRDLSAVIKSPVSFNSQSFASSFLKEYSPSLSKNHRSVPVLSATPLQLLTSLI